MKNDVNTFTLPTKTIHSLFQLNNVKIHNQEFEQRTSCVVHVHFRVISSLEASTNGKWKRPVIKNNWNSYRIIEAGRKSEKIRSRADHWREIRIFSDDTQRETRFKELEGENERNKQVLTARIQQLQSEIDALVKEKKQEQPSDGEPVEVAAKSGSKSRPLPSIGPAFDSQVAVPTFEPSPPPSNTDKSVLSSGAIRRPTIIPAPSSKNGSQALTKPAVIPPVVAARTQQPTSMTNSTSSIRELPSSPVPTVAKRHVIPTRSISTVSQSPVVSNHLRSSPSNTGGTNVPRSGITADGIPRLTKTSHQIVKPTHDGNINWSGETHWTGKSRCECCFSVWEALKQFKGLHGSILLIIHCSRNRVDVVLYSLLFSSLLSILVDKLFIRTREWWSANSDRNHSIR